MNQRPKCIECKEAPADAKQNWSFYCASCWMKIFAYNNKGDRHGVTQINRTQKGTLS